MTKRIRIEREGFDSDSVGSRFQVTRIDGVLRCVQLWAFGYVVTWAPGR